ncbi:integumentary mucin B.1-like [Cetorhinus maximus]
MPETTIPTCKIGRDPNNSCISYSCVNNSQMIHKIACEELEECSESEKIWDDVHCCYSCHQRVETCKAEPYKKTVKVESCKPVVINLSRCEGYCPGSAKYEVIVGRMMHECTCCHEDEIEERQLELQCDIVHNVFKYIFIKSCTCRECKGSE